MSPSLQVTKTEVSAQIKRFAGHPNFPANPRELADALLAAASDRKTLIQIADLLMEICHFCPVPADVYDAMETIREVRCVPEYVGSGYKCATCQDTGWIGYEKDDASFAKRCSDCTALREENNGTRSH